MKFRRKAKQSAGSAEADASPEGANGTADAEKDLDKAADKTADTSSDKAPDKASAESTDAVGSDDSAASSVPAGTGPRDGGDVPEADREELVDLGSLLVGPIAGFELRLQVEESTQQVRSVQLVTDDGIIDLRAFAAPRNGDLWTDVRPDVTADHEKRGGTVTEVDGDFGVELHCQLPVKRADGTKAIQPTRIIGINGPRWMLRATMLGRPAMKPEEAADFFTALDQLVVERGSSAMAPGDPLPLRLPDSAKRIDESKRDQ